MIQIPNISGGEPITGDLMVAIVQAIRELQTAAITSVQPPLQRDGNTLLSGAPSGGGGGVEVLWGKATADWDSGNTIELNPCARDGSDVDEDTTVFCHIFSPENLTPIFAQVAMDDVLAYLPITDDGSEGLLINVQCLPDPGSPGDALTLDGDSYGQWESAASDCDEPV